MATAMKNTQKNTLGETKAKLTPDLNKNILFGYSSLDAFNFEWSICKISQLQPHLPLVLSLDLDSQALISKFYEAEGKLHVCK